MNVTPAEQIVSRERGGIVRWIGIGLTLAVILTVNGPARAQSDNAPSERKVAYDSKHTVRRQYTAAERVRYQLWDYTWNPQPDEPITRIEVRIGEQKVYVYQGDHVAGISPTTTGKDGHNTPTGDYTIIKKEINHKSNLYGDFLDANGYIVDGDAKAGEAVPSGEVYDAADMPYYMKIRDDGTGLHAGDLPGYRASHGCIRLPNAFAELLYSNVSEGTPVDVVP
ncbi:MAG TPA: L,D-transpeptidase family protein [Candidatus Methylacidiphilales bacterium]|nr:L,D-transpeptidase family protein [Candidatus Methylacidiphilales bacterium]